MSQKILPPPDLVARWDTRDVADWLRHNDMPEFISAFNNNCVNGARLLELDENTIKSYSGQLPQHKIIKLLDKVRKCKKEKSGGGIFHKLKNRGSSVPAVPDRDYRTCQQANSKVDDDDAASWGSEFSDNELEMDENYESPPDPMRSEAPRYPPRNQFPPPVNYHYDEDEEEDCSEDYIIPIESPPQPAGDSDEDQYLAPDTNADDELYEVPEDDSHFQPSRMRQPDMPPARPPKSKKDYISTSPRPPQMLVLAPSLTAPSDLPPRPPARRSVSPIRKPNSYRSQPEIHEDYEEETYDAPNEDMEDCDQTYAVPDDASPEPCTRSPAFPLPMSEPKKFMMPPARPAKKPLPSPTNDPPAIPPPITRYPKSDTSKPAKDLPIIRHHSESSRPPKEPPVIKADDSNASVINKMKQRFEQRSPTLPRRDVHNGSNQETSKNSSFLHKKQPPLPSKNELPPKEPRTNSKPELPRRKYPVANKPALPQTNSSSVSSLASKLSDSSKITPSPAHRLPPTPGQRNVPSPVQRNTPIPSQLSQPPISPNRKLPYQDVVVVGSSNTKSGTNSMDGYPWYHADLPREKAQKSLEEFRRDGAFLVRDSKRGGAKNPFTLSLWYNNQVRNLQMRSRSDGKYALGSMKDGEQTFDSPLDLVVFHQSNPLILANNEGKTKLKTPCPVY